MNLKVRPEGALVIGWDDEITVQVEGVAHRPQGSELDAAKAASGLLDEIGKVGRTSSTSFFKMVALLQLREGNKACWQSHRPTDREKPAVSHGTAILAN